MRIAVITFGTRGSARPLIALGRGLIEAGHDVQLLTDASALPLAYAHRVPAAPLVGDMHDALAAGSPLDQVIQQGLDGAELMRAIGDFAAQHVESWLLDLIGAAEGADAIICAGPPSFAALSAAEYLRIPVIGTGLWPFTPTHEFPSALQQVESRTAMLNRLGQEALSALLWRRVRPHLNQARRRVCAQPPRQTMWPDLPIIYGISRHLLVEPADWPRWCRISGAWFLPELNWQPSDELAEFLTAGEPPIYISFGSAVRLDRRRTVELLVQALGGRRAVFHTGRSRFSRADLPASILPIRDVPPEWLFPRVALVVHPGTAGTSHLAARAGVPSVVVPFACDQFFWARRLAALGVAPCHVPGPDLDAGTLARLIDSAGQPGLRQRATALGAAIAQEDGIGLAVEWIEHFVRRTRPTTVSPASLHSVLDSRPL